MLSVIAGLTGGAIHALSGPDHLAAVAPLSLGNRRAGLIAGLDWGVGHGAGVALIGALALWARDLIAIDAVSGWSELLVGFLLLGMAGWAGYRGIKLLRQADQPARAPHPRKRHATVGVGALHGSAGASHLLGVLPAAGLSVGGAAMYVVAYVAGATLSMAVIGMAAGELSARGGLKLQPVLLLGTAVIAALVGIAWIVSSWPAS